MRKTMLVALASVFGICVLIVAANAATTWQGPPSNCTSPEGSTCNTDGVVWNRTTPAQDGDFNLTGSGILGTGLTIQTGDLNANSLIFLKQNGDLWLSDGKSLVVNKDGSQSFLKIGNYGATTPNSNIKVTVFGDLETATEEGEGYATKISTPTLCLNGDCQSAWPTSGGGGTVTGATANGGLVLTGTTLGLSTSCTNDQVLKWNGTAWACSSDSGSVTSITPGTGITTSPNPITGSGTVSLDTTYADGRFVNTSGDTMSGSLNIIGAPYPSLSVDNGMGVYGQVSINNSSMALYAVAPTAGFFAGTSKGVEAYAEPGGSAGYFANKPSGLAVTKSVELATKDNAVEAVLGNIKLNSGNSLCFDTDCKSSWSSVGLSGITVGSGMTGGGTSGNVSIGLGATQLLPTSACTSNQVPKWNGTAWTCAADASGTGDVTDVLAGTGITVTNSGGPQPTVALSADKQLPAGCTVGQQTQWDGTKWTCDTDNYKTGIAGKTETSVSCSSYQIAQIETTCGGGSCYNYWTCKTLSSLETGPGNTFVNTSGDTMSGALTVNAQLSSASEIASTGVNAGFAFAARDGVAPTRWVWYANNGVARLFNQSVGDVVKADVYGNLQIGLLNTGCVKDADGTIIAGTCTSDERLKKNILPLNNILNSFTKLQPVKFTWKDSDEDDYGLIAQDVEKVFPDLVVTDRDGYKNVSYNVNLHMFTIEAIKELKVQNDMLQAENDMLLRRIEALEAKVK